MNWVKANEKLPDHTQEVLIRHHTIVDLATYDKTREKFILKDGTTIKAKADILWLELVGSH
jgi:hypothetical protein